MEYNSNFISHSLKNTYTNLTSLCLPCSSSSDHHLRYGEGVKQETTSLGREQIDAIGAFPQTVGLQLKKITMKSLLLLLIEIQIGVELNTHRGANVIEFLISRLSLNSHRHYFLRLRISVDGFRRLTTLSNVGGLMRKDEDQHLGYWCWRKQVVVTGMVMGLGQWNQLKNGSTSPSDVW
ncbi:unnamed protein product [Lactuca virosa]|uniref:Uncharacterized protein n=1 Tax=Lactuca virosa TaxID=75947 RepID=A0AAU9MJL0_9ASTR|nr:unnamed protein product [Lactuca virosa]